MAKIRVWSAPDAPPLEWFGQPLPEGQPFLGEPLAPRRDSGESKEQLKRPSIGQELCQPEANVPAPDKKKGGPGKQGSLF